MSGWRACSTQFKAHHLLSAHDSLHVHLLRCGDCNMLPSLCQDHTSPHIWRQKLVDRLTQIVGELLSSWWTYLWWISSLREDDHDAFPWLKCNVQFFSSCCSESPVSTWSIVFVVATAHRETVLVSQRNILPWFGMCHLTSSSCLRLKFRMLTLIPLAAWNDQLSGDI